MPNFFRFLKRYCLIYAQNRRYFLLQQLQHLHLASPSTPALAPSRSPALAPLANPSPLLTSAAASPPVLDDMARDRAASLTSVDSSGFEMTEIVNEPAVVVEEAAASPECMHLWPAEYCPP